MEIIDQKILHDSVTWPLPPKYGSPKPSHTAPGNLLIYYASQLIPITTSGKNSNAINVGTFYNVTNGLQTKCNVVSHEFVDGVGTITFDKDVNVISSGHGDYIIASNSIIDILLPSTITTITAYNNFINAINSSKLVIPKSVNSVTYGALVSATSSPLKELYIESENLIWSSSSTIVYGAKLLEKVVIYGDITMSGSYNNDAFGGCFTNVPSYKIYVPDDLVNSYKTKQGWARHADHIVPLSTLQ